MLALRALAEARSEEEPAKPKQPRTKGATVNEHMAAMLQKDPSLVRWAASWWAEKIGSHGCGC